MPLNQAAKPPEHGIKSESNSDLNIDMTKILSHVFVVATYSTAECLVSLAQIQQQGILVKLKENTDSAYRSAVIIYEQDFF